MKSISRYLSFPILILSMILGGFAVQAPQAVGPISVNLVPISSLATASTLADTNFFYVVQGSRAASYKKTTGAILKAYIGVIPYSFTDSVTGCSAVITTAVSCSEAGYNVICRLGTSTGTSNATTKVIQHLPAAITPTTAQLVTLTEITNNGTVSYQVKATVGTDGTITLTLNGSAFTASGTFTISAGTTFAYTLL